MLTAALTLAVTTPTSAPPPTDAWLQLRLDHVLGSIGERPDSVAVSVSRDGKLSIDDDGNRMVLPTSALLAARTEADVDGLLAMMLAYRSSGATVRVGRGPGLASILAYAGLVAATGGASDPATGKDSTVIPLGTIDAHSTPAEERNPAWRGLAWNNAAGHCATTIVAYLRRLGAGGPSTLGARGDGTAGYAKGVLRQLGVLASPNPVSCPADDRVDARFVEQRRTLLGASSD